MHGWRDNLNSFASKWEEINKGVCHTVALPFTLKKYLKAKRRTTETQIFHHAKNIIFRTSPKRNQNPSRYYYNSTMTNLKFQHKPKYHHLSKILV